MLRSFITDNLEQIAELCRKHHVRRLAVFGSAVREDFDPERSDVDFLVEFLDGPEKHSFDNFLALQRALAELLQRKVDLVVGAAIRRPRLRMLIAQEEESLYAA